MFIAHLPAGYLLGQGFNRLRLKGVVAAAMLGSIFPDLDLFYFYLVDGKQHHHHSYWIHYPLPWVVLFIASLVWLYFRRQSAWAILSTVFNAGVLLHLALDCVSGDIMLFAPFSKTFYSVVTIKAVYQPWWLNFFLHWTFLAELLIIAASVAIFMRNRRRRKQAASIPPEHSGRP